MKNLPENDFWNSLTQRMRNYQELPDDDAWDKISGAVPESISQQSWSNGKWVTAVVLIFVLGLLSGYWLHDYKDLHEDHAVKNKLEVPAGDGTMISAIPKAKLTNPDEVSLDTPEENSIKTHETSTRPPTSEYKIPLAARGSSHGRRSAKHGHFQDSVESSTSDLSKRGTFSVFQGDDNLVEKIAKQSPDTASTDSVLINDEKYDRIHEQMKLEKKEKKRILRGDFYAVITPLLSFLKLSPVKDDQVEIVGMESPGILSKERFSWSLEIGMQRPLYKRLSWNMGLSIFHQRQRLTYTYYNASKYDIKGDAHKGYTITPEVAARTFEYNMTNVGLSAGLLFMIKTKGLRHYFGGGMQFQKGLLHNGREYSYHNATSSYLNYQLSYRLELPIRRNLDFFLQPVFIHNAWSDESLKQPFKLTPSRAGIGTGVVYHFR